MKRIILLGCCIALMSCGGGGSSSGTGPDLQKPGTLSYSPADCSTAGQNEFVNRVMNDTYFWYDKVPQVDYGQYGSPSDLLNALMYHALDKWSYIASKQTFHAYLEEDKYIGLGYRAYIYGGSYLRISYVYKDSPAHAAGLKRGDTILALNGISIADIAANNLWSSTYGEDEVGVAVVHRVQDSTGTIRDITLSADWVTIDTVMANKIFDYGGKRVGYLVYQSFSNRSQAVLSAVFSDFQQQGVNELIVDLRYNGGGQTVVARYLAGLIAGFNTNNNTFTSYVFNDKHSYWNFVSNFTNPSNSLNLGSVIFITTSQTCSASELVVNSLKPYINTAAIGRATCGKPVGFYAHDFCDSTLNAMEVTLVNSRGEGAYFNGLTPTCYAYDDVSSQIGDVHEPMLAEALYYSANNRCSALSRTGRISATEASKEPVPLYGIKREAGAM